MFWKNKLMTGSLSKSGDNLPTPSNSEFVGKQAEYCDILWKTSIRELPGIWYGNRSGKLCSDLRQSEAPQTYVSNQVSGSGHLL